MGSASVGKGGGPGALVTPPADGKRWLSNRGNVIRVQVAALMRPWCNSTRSQHAPPVNHQSVSRGLSPPCAGPPPSPSRACVFYVSEDEWLGPPAAATAGHRHSEGCGPARPPSTAIQTGGGGECIVHARPALAGEGTPPGRWLVGPVWRTWRGVAQSTHGSSQLHTCRSHPPGQAVGRGLPPSTQPHARQRQTSLHTPPTSRAGGLAGSSGPSRGGHQQAAKPPPVPVQGENKGVRFEPPPTQQIITLGQKGRRQHSIRTALTGPPATVRHWAPWSEAGPAGEKTRSASSAASRASTTP